MLNSERITTEIRTYKSIHYRCLVISIVDLCWKSIFSRQGSFTLENGFSLIQFFWLFNNFIDFGFHNNNFIVFMVEWFFVFNGRSGLFFKEGSTLIIFLLLKRRLEFKVIMKVVRKPGKGWRKWWRVDESIH